MLEYFNDLARGLENKLAAGGLETVARKKYALELAKLGARLYSEDEKIAWCGVLAPFDLLNALGVTSCFIEFVGAMLASTGTSGPMMEASEQAGYSTDICSYHRAIQGAVLQGALPEPEFLIATTCPCSGGLATIETLARHFNKALFLLDIPHQNDRESVEYLAAQHRDMVEFVTSRTGRPLDPERLRETMIITNKTRELLVEIYELASAVPTPARQSDMANLALVMSLLMGTQSGIEVAEAYRDEFKAKVESGIAGFPGEKLRLLWFQNRIQFRNPFIKMLDEEFDAAVVMDELNYIFWEPIDPDDPYEGIAKRVLSNPLLGPVENRLNNLLKLVEIYKVDGIICPCHWGCRQGTGIRGLLETRLRRHGIPVLNLEVDCIDPRNFSAGQLKTRMGAFVEMLQGRKAS